MCGVGIDVGAIPQLRGAAAEEVQAAEERGQRRLVHLVPEIEGKMAGR